MVGGEAGDWVMGWLLALGGSLQKETSEKKPLQLTILSYRSVTQHVIGNSARSTGVQAPNTFYFKLPYIGYFSSIPQKCVHRLSHSYCNNANIVLAFSSFKVGSLFSVKDPIPNGLWSCVVYKFSCAGCAACYVSETTWHFNTSAREHLETYRASHILKNLKSSSACRSACSHDNFAIIDQASLQFALKIKEVLLILWDKPTLHAQVKHVNLKLSIVIVLIIAIFVISLVFIFHFNLLFISHFT